MTLLNYFVVQNEVQEVTAVLFNLLNFAHPYSVLAFSYLSCVFLQLETVILIFQCCL